MKKSKMEPYFSKGERSIINSLLKYQVNSTLTNIQIPILSLVHCVAFNLNGMEEANFT